MLATPRSDAGLDAPALRPAAAFYQSFPARLDARDAQRYRLAFMAGVVPVRADILERMVAEARRDPHLECCGLLGGRGDAISAIFPAPNALASASEFEIAPENLFRVFREMRAGGWQHLGIYHSHPAGDNVPSRRDVERAHYPDAAYFIVSPLPHAPRPVRAFSIRDTTVTELIIEPI